MKMKGFNLVIERLLISGYVKTDRHRNGRDVSISLSSGFSFQVLCADVVSVQVQQFQSRYRAASHFRGSGSHRKKSLVGVSISLSSGFSFQGSTQLQLSLIMSKVSISLSSGFSFQERKRKRKEGERMVSISLSSGFSFQEIFLNQLKWEKKFQSRYRAASHFRGHSSKALTDPPLRFQSRYRAASHFR